MPSSEHWVICGTWPFCRDPMETVAHRVQQQQQQNHQKEHQQHEKDDTSSSSLLCSSLIDIIEAVELNPKQPTVGVPGSAPNSNGVHELDAAIMLSKTSKAKRSHTSTTENENNSGNNSSISGRCGAVLGLRGFDGAIRVADAVARKSAHSTLVGDGAREFAVRETEHDKTVRVLQIPQERQDEIRKKHLLAESVVAQQQHHQDTLGVCGARVTTTRNSSDGSTAVGVELMAAVSSSGLANKSPGRVGDSAVFGSGLYAEAGIGACVATGDGDAIALFPICYVAVQAMKLMKSVDAACQYAIDQFLRNPNVASFLENANDVKNRLSDGGPLVGLCGISVRGRGDSVPTFGGACCENWKYEFAMSSCMFRCHDDGDSTEHQSVDQAAVAEVTSYSEVGNNAGSRELDHSLGSASSSVIMSSTSNTTNNSPSQSGRAAVTSRPLPSSSDDDDDDDDDGGDNDNDSNTKMTQDDTFRKLFEQFDDDKNGALSRTESLAAVCHFMPHASTAEAMAMIRAADANHDGLISFSEFVTLIRRLRKGI